MAVQLPTGAGGGQLVGIFVGGFGVAAVLRAAFNAGSGALLLIGLACSAAGAFLIFRKRR